MMFNFAWLVRYYDTHMSKLRKTTKNKFTYEVFEQVSSMKTDTHAL